MLWWSLRTSAEGYAAEYGMPTILLGLQQNAAVIIGNLSPANVDCKLVCNLVLCISGLLHSSDVLGSRRQTVYFMPAQGCRHHECSYLHAVGDHAHDVHRVGSVAAMATCDGNVRELVHGTMH